MRLSVLPFGFALAGLVRAETFTVNPSPGLGDFLSPAAALASPLVEDGDSIAVAPGVYSGTLVVAKAVRLVATAGADLTVLDGAGSGPVLTISADATVRGFTITGGGGPASVGGVAITATASVRLIGNVVTENHPLGDFAIPAGGVHIAAGASAELRDNEIRANTSLSVGGLWAGGGSTVTLFRDRIHGNGGSGTTTGGVIFGGSGRFVDVQVTGNHGSGIGGMFLAGAIGPSPSGALVDLVNCTIFGNFGASPVGSVGGLFFDDGGVYTIRNTLIHGNIGSVGADIAFSSDFLAPPVLGILDLDYSKVGAVGAGVVPGPHMLPPFIDPMLVAPVAAGPFGPVLFGDFAPAAGSLLVDAGLDSAFPGDLPPTDAQGAERFQGLAVEVGAFEVGHRRVRRVPSAPTRP